MSDLYPIFLTVVLVVRDQASHLERMLQEVIECTSYLVSDYEIVVIDNASTDESILILKGLVGESGLPNLQIYALTEEVDAGTAAWVGLENALGDFIAVVDPLVDDINYLPEMIEKAVNGIDVVFAENEQKPKQSFIYRFAYAVFNALYKSFSGIQLTKEAPQYRLLSKRVTNFILQHPQPAMKYRHLPASGGFTRANFLYSSTPKILQTKRLYESIDRGMRLLVSTTRAPMRLVTTITLFGAIANLLYTIYVVLVGIFKQDVAPGWISLSLQQSGMFFLISLVLLVLGEYILHMARLSNEGPLYYVGQEFTSVKITRREKLNIEEVLAKENSSKATKLVRES